MDLPLEPLVQDGNSGGLERLGVGFSLVAERVEAGSPSKLAALSGDACQSASSAALRR